MGSDGDYHHSPSASWSQHRGPWDEPNCAPVPDGCRPLGTTAACSQLTPTSGSPVQKGLPLLLTRKSAASKNCCPLSGRAYGPTHIPVAPSPSFPQQLTHHPNAHLCTLGWLLLCLVPPSLPCNLSVAPNHQHVDTLSSVPTVGGKTNINRASPFSFPDQAHWLKSCLHSLLDAFHSNSCPCCCVQTGSTHRLPGG